ncbi:MAG: fimbrial protein [Plesiomonas sp.]
MNVNLFIIKVFLFFVMLYLSPRVALAACSQVMGGGVGTSYTNDQVITFNKIEANMPVTSWSSFANGHFNNCTYGEGTWVAWSARGINYSGKEIVMDGKTYSVYSLSAKNFDTGVVDNNLFGLLIEGIDLSGKVKPFIYNDMVFGAPSKLQSSGGFGYPLRARIIALKTVPNGYWTIADNDRRVTDGISYLCKSRSIATCVSENNSMESVSLLPRMTVLIKMQTCKVNYSNLVNLPKVSFIDFNRASGIRVGTTPFTLGFDCAASSSASYPIKIGISFQDANEILSNGITLRNVAVNASNVKLALYSQSQEELKLNTKVPLFEYKSTAAAQFTKDFYVSYISTAAKTTPGAVKSTLIFNVTYD